MEPALRKATGNDDRNDAAYPYQTRDLDGILSEATARSNPFGQFGRWIGEAVKEGVEEPNAMVLATASRSGMPSARIVLLHSFSELGFVFFTGRESRKYREIEENPNASMLFYWKEVRRQVRIEGELAQLPPETAATRLEEAVEGTRSFEQGVVPDASFYLNYMFSERTRLWARHRDTVSPRWSAFELSPDRFEFWEGRDDGTNDRMVFLRTSEGWETKASARSSMFRNKRYGRFNDV